MSSQIANLKRIKSFLGLRKCYQCGGETLVPVLKHCVSDSRFQTGVVMSDIEMDPPKAPSGAKRPLSPLLLSTTTTKRVKLDLPQDELTSLNTAMIRKSEELMWPALLERASEVPSYMTSSLSAILSSLLFSLAKTTAKDSFISPLGTDEAGRFVEGFNIDERRELEDGIKMCLESGDWSGLITHRMYAVTTHCKMYFFDHGHSKTSARDQVRF